MSQREVAREGRVVDDDAAPVERVAGAGVVQDA